jgi:crotonobetainyl-CoA:carnitine CoA-transferase CaiB-like acyl-CoA transferase
MLRVADLPAHPYYRARAFLRLVTHPHIDEPFYAENTIVCAQTLPRPPQLPAPLQGEHTISLVADLLGLGATRIEELLAAGVLEQQSS